MAQPNFKTMNDESLKSHAQKHHRYYGWSALGFIAAATTVVAGLFSGVAIPSGFLVPITAVLTMATMGTCISFLYGMLTVNNTVAELKERGIPQEEIPTPSGPFASLRHALKNAGSALKFGLSPKEMAVAEIEAVRTTELAEKQAAQDFEAAVRASAGPLQKPIRITKPLVLG